MFDYLMKKIPLIRTKEELRNLENKNVLVEGNINNEEIINVKISDIIEIYIKKECTLSEYSDAIDKYEELKNELPVKVLFTNTNGCFSSSTKILKQKIYIIKENNLKYFITLCENQIQISQYKTIDSNIYETELRINGDNHEYKIIKSIHDLNYSTGEIKWYPSKESDHKYFVLDKIEALSLASELLNNLNKIKKINNVLILRYIYDFLNLLPEEDYCPVINDDILFLSCPDRYKTENIKKLEYVNFDIILNETKEKVGCISVKYPSEGFSYAGNVGYFINEKYRNNHYATKALSLLTKLLKSNEFEGDKDLYISTKLDNIKSQKVIINNGGELFYEGSVPIDDSINYINGIKNVKIYKIEVKNKKS